MRKPYLDPVERKRLIVNAAISTALEIGYGKMTLTTVAKTAKCPASLIMYHFGCMAKLRESVMTEAVQRGILPIIAHGLALQDTHAQAASEKMKAAALETLAA